MDRKIIYSLLAVIVVSFLGYAIWDNAHGNSTSTTTLVSEEGEPVKVTPVEEMPVRTAEGTPSIDLATYRLKVGGLVDRELSLSFDEIRQLPAEEHLVDLNCVEGWTITGLWKGPRLKDVLDLAGIGEEAETVVFSSPGGYTTSLTLADIDQTDPLMAYDVNGEPLTVEHGFPLRLVVPDRYGYKWIKWIVDIQVISGEYKGYWESAGYSNKAEAK